jgi:hypothetical protein
VHADGRGVVVVEFDRDLFDAAVILGSGVVVEAVANTEVEHRGGFGGVDRLKQAHSAVDRVGDRGQVRVECAAGDLVHQQPLCLDW